MWTSPAFIAKKIMNIDLVTFEILKMILWIRMWRFIIDFFHISISYYAFYLLFIVPSSFESTFLIITYIRWGNWGYLGFWINFLCKVHIFWQGHKILWNLHLTFVCMYVDKSKVEISQTFVAFALSTGMESFDFNLTKNWWKSKKLIS